MSFTKLIQKEQNLFYEMTKWVCNQSKSIASISNSWYFYFHVDSQSSFSQSFISMLSYLRYLQLEFTTHEELNRVKSIFRDCCSILLNCEKDNKILKRSKNAWWQDIWSSNTYKLINKILNKILNCLLMIASSSTFTFIIFFDKQSFISTSFNKLSKSNETFIDKREKNHLIASKRNWKKTKNNVTSVHRIQYLTELTSI